ncbi:MAG: SGNH/GDSL hydrolase family protein [Methylorubrum rhodinum]|uniref:SGNH/GDSL hydrolase family protein n=1 Tax=Methylorubrum rhodinum TaxID=29428 RepID=UPI003BAE29AE
MTACPDLRGLAALSGLRYSDGAAIGPTEHTDELGRKCWRFSGSDALFVANALNAISARGISIFLVSRVHKHRASVALFSPRYTSYTDDTTNTTCTTTHATLRAVVSSNGVPSLNQVVTLAGGYKFVPGCQLNVSGFVSRTTANGACRTYMNNDVLTSGQSGTTTTGMVGGVIGATPAASNATTGSTNWFDLYELAIWNDTQLARVMSNSEADAIAAALVSNWGITAIDRQLIVEGDSITDGVATVVAPTTSADNLGMQLCKPGASLVQASCRVLNFGTSGNTISNLTLRKNAVQSVFGINSAGSGQLYAGGDDRNIVAVQIGRNDMGSVGGFQTPATVYANILTLFNNATGGAEGYLQRGFKVVMVCNIAGENPGYQTAVETLRDMYADTATHLPNPTFLSDLSAGTGQTYEGQVDVLHLYDVTVGGATAFKTSADAGVGPYYDAPTSSGGDGTHLVPLGIGLMASGGDTPQYGYGALA